MITKPKLKDCFYMEIVEPHHVFLLTENKHHVLNGRVYKLLVPLLTGQHTVDELTTRLNGQVSFAEVFYALRQMETKGYIVPADDSVPPETAAFWHSLNVDIPTGLTRLQQTQVTLTAVGDADAEPLRQALAQLHIQTGDSGYIHVVVTDDYLQPQLATINDHTLAESKPWMLVKLVGTTLWLGPVFRPGETACWACLAQRLQANRQLESYILRQRGEAAPLKTSLGTLPTTQEMAAHYAATEILKWVLQGDNEQLNGRIVTLNLADLGMQSHVLVRRPQCPICGQPENHRQPRSVTLSPAQKSFTGDGGHRAVLPEATYEHHKHHVSPLTGVITWLVNTTEDDSGLAYSYIAGHNFALAQNTTHWLRQNLRSHTGGKGMTEIQARVSAMGEAIERYSMVYRGDEYLVRGNYQSLGPEAIHLHDCLHFSEQQYANRHEWNTSLSGGRFHVIPNPFKETQEIEWAPLWSLTHQVFRYLPAAFCYFGHPETNEFFYCAGDSNGTSAGNTLTEAILQGFLELVERDSVAIWWYNRVKRPKLDLDSFNLPYLYALKPYYEGLKREFWVLDITADLGIPTFAAVSRRTDKAVEDILVGFGAHLDPQIALLRAVTEMNQFLPSVSRQAADGGTLYRWPEDDAVHWWRTATLENQPYLLPNDEVRTLASYPRLDGDDLMQDVATCVEIARRAGLEVLVLDATRPDIEMPVCRVVVPGMRHFWRRLGPGRLYDVPVKLGWLTNPQAEEALNPFSLFF